MKSSCIAFLAPKETLHSAEENASELCANCAADDRYPLHRRICAALPGASTTIQRKAERREKPFRDNPFHPALKTEKLQPLKREYWSFRIDRSYRIIFRFEGTDKVLFMTCGHHHWIYRYLLAH